MTQNTIHMDDWELLAQVSQVFRTVSDSFTDEVDMHRGQGMLLCAVSKLNGIDGHAFARQRIKIDPERFHREQRQLTR